MNANALAAPTTDITARTTNATLTTITTTESTRLTTNAATVEELPATFATTLSLANETSTTQGKYSLYSSCNITCIARPF